MAGTDSIVDSNCSDSGLRICRFFKNVVVGEKKISPSMIDAIAAWFKRRWH